VPQAPISLDDQKAAQDSAGGYSASLVDVCLSSFLTDHCNSDNEILIGAYVDGSTPLAEVQSQLLSELNDSGFDRRPNMDADKAAEAVKALFAGHDDMSRPFDASLEVLDEEEAETMGGDEMCQAWVRVSWPEEEEPD
jgi:hypothetical protein